MRNTFLCCLVAALSLLATGCTQTINDTDVENEILTLTEVRKLTSTKPDKTLLIDARTPADYAAGHIPGAANVLLAQVSGMEGDIDPRLSRYSTLIVYGKDPGSVTAMALGKRLITSGYKGVRYYPEGIMGWQAAGLPVEKSAPPVAPAPAPTTTPAPAAAPAPVPATR